MKLKQFIFALVAMLSGFAFTANAQTAVSSFDELKAALASSTNIVVNGDIAVDEAITIPSGTTVAGDGTLRVRTEVYVVSTENPYPGVTYNKTATKNGSISGTASCAVVYEISLDGGESWFTDTTEGKAQAVTVKTDGTKSISTSFQSAFTSAKCGEIVHMLKDAHVQSTNSKKNNGPLRSYYGLILEGNGHTIYTDVESSGASNEYSTIKFTSYLAGTGADVRPVLKNVTIDSQKNAKADLDLVSGDVTFTVSLFNVNLLNKTANATLSFLPGTSVVINKSNVKLFDSSIPAWDAGSANAIEFYSGDYSLSFNSKCKVYGGSFSKDAANYLVERAEISNVNGKYVVTCKEEKAEAAVEVKPSEEFTEKATEEEKAVAEELSANTAVAENNVELPADVATFTVQLTDVESENEATTKVTFTVTPSNVLGEKVSTPTEAITFRLPVPAAWTGKAKVSHNGAELGVYDINEENGAKYVEVSSSSFSEFSVEAIVPTDVEVATLAELQAALADNSNELPIIITAQIEIPAGETVTIDLNGKTVNSVFNGNSTTNHIYALSNKGTLTITDTEGNGSINSRGIYNYGSLTLNAGAINAIDGNGGYAVNNQSGSTFVMNGGVVAATYEDDHQSSSGGYDATALKVPAGCTATLNGGTINNVCDFTFAIDAAGTLNIPAESTITVNGTHGAIYVSGGETTINAGTFQIPADEYTRTDNVLYVSGGSLVVNGGTFIGDSDTASGGSCLSDAVGKAVVNGGTFKGSSGGDVWGTTGTTIKGGTFENLIEKQHIADGYELNENGTVVQVNYAAQIGEQGYATLAAALEATKTMTGDVTVEILDKVTFNQPLIGNYTSINFVGKDTDAEMYLDVQGYTTATGKKVSFTDLKLSKSEGGFIANAGFMNVAFGIYDVEEVTYTNCTFENGACASSGKVAFNGCTFKKSWDKYGLWAYGNVDVTVQSSTFADYRGIKMYAENGADASVEKANLTVKNTNFSAVDNKPAIVLTYGESVVLEGNTYSSTGTFELDLDGKPNGVAVTSDVAPVCVNDNGACGVLVDGKIYTTVAQAAEVATETSTVTLLHSSNETVEFPMGTTIDKNGFTADNVTTAQPFADYVVLPQDITVNNYKALFGSNTVTDGVNYYATLQAAVEAVAKNAGVTRQAGSVLYCKPGADVGSLQHAPVVSTLTVYGNGANVTGGSERDFDLGNTDPSSGKDITADMTLTVKHLNGCGAWGAKATEHTVNLVFENCANMGKVFITGTTGTLNITMTDCAFEGVLPEAVYSNADGAITLTNVAFSNLNKAVNLNHKAAGTQTVTINGCSFTNCGNDVAADQIPVRVLSSVEGGKTVLNVSNATFSGTPTGGADILLDYGVGESALNIAGTDANVSVEIKKDVATTTTVSKSEEQTFTNAAPVAEVNGVKYATLGEAVNALKDGETLIITSDITAGANEFIELNGKKNVTIAAAEGVVINGNISVGYHASHTDNNVDRSASTFTVDGLTVNGTLTVCSNDAKLVVKNTKAAQITVKTYREGMDIALNGNTADGSMGTAANSYGMFLVPNATGYNLAVDGNTFKNINSHAFVVQGSGDGSAVTAANSIAVTNNTFESWGTGGKADRAAFKIWADTKYAPAESDLAGTTNAMRELVDAIAAGGNTYSSTADNTVEFDAYGAAGDAENFPDPMYAVAKIGDVEYATLEEAFAAAAEGQTIAMLDDATPALTSQRAITKAAVIDLGGKTLTLTEDDLYFGTTKFKNGTIIVDPSVKPSTAVFWMFANQTLTFDNVKIVATGVTGTYLIGLEGENSDLNLLNGSEILVENTTALDLDIICVNGTNTCDIKVENSKVNVTNLDGRVFFRGNYTVKDSEVNLAGITKAGFRIEAGQTLSIEGTSKVNIEGEPRDGGIHITDLSATYTKAETATVNATVNEPKVAKVGENTYRTLAQAVAAVEDGGTITLIANETFTKNNRYNNGGWWDGLGYSGDKSFTIDLNGFTVSQDGSLNDYLFWFKNVGSKENIITIKNGTLDAGTTAFCALCTSSSHENKLTINTEKLNIINNISNGSTVKVRGGAVLNVNDGTVITGKNSYLGIECLASTVNIYDGAEIYMNGTSSYNGCLVGVCGGGTVNVYGGYGKGVKGGFIAMTSGGTINISGGEWIANTDGTVGNNSNLYVLTAQNNKYESGYKGASIINVTGGTFRGGMDAWILNDATVEKAELNIKGGNFNANPTNYVAKDYIAVENNGVWTVVKAVAKVGETAYASLESAFKAATSGCTIEILSDVTVDYYWDARNTGAKFTVPVTINGNDHIIKFTNTVYDGGNYMSAFRFEADAVVNNLTIDMSEAVSGFAGRFRAISAKANLTVDGCTFIGNGSTNNTRAIIFGEGATAIDQISITNSTFTGWRRGISDNESGKDVAATVTVTGNTLTDAGVAVSATDNVTFTDNAVSGAYVDIRSYTTGNSLNVTATGNTLEANTDKSYNYIKAGGDINAQDEFVLPSVAISYNANGDEVAAYSDFESAIAAVAADASIVRIEVVSDYVQKSIANTSSYYDVKGDLVIASAEGKNYTVKGCGFAVRVQGATLTIDENLTIEGLDVVANGFATSGDNMVINGTLKAVSLKQWTSNGTITVNGKVELGYGDGQFDMAYGNGAVVVNGNGDRTVAQFKAGYSGARGNGGILTLNDTYFEAGAWFNVAGSNTTINMNNSLLKVSGGDAVGSLTLAASNVINLDINSQLVADMISGAGTINVDATELNAESVTVIAGNLTGFTGTINVEGEGIITERTENGLVIKADPNYIAELEIIDGEYGDYTYDSEKTVGNLTYSRTLPAAGIWYPVFLPFDVPVGALAENFDVARINDLHTNFSDEDGSIVKMWVEYIVKKSGTLAAGKPFLVRAKNSANLKMSIVLEEVKLYPASKKSTITVSSAITEVTFEGVYEVINSPVSTPSTRYMAVNADGVWDEFNTYSLNPFRVMMTLNILDEEYYINSTASLSVGSRVVGEENEDGTTTIYDVFVDRENDGTIYDLQGRKVLEITEPGIYIINGKKVLVK